MSKADDEIIQKLDMQAELEAAMAAVKSKKPVRASRRKGEVTAPALALVGDDQVVVEGAAPTPSPASEPVEAVAAEPSPEPTLIAVPAPAPAPAPVPAPAPALAPAPTQAPATGPFPRVFDPAMAPAPRTGAQPPVGPFPARIGGAPRVAPAASASEPSEPRPPTPRQLAVLLTRAGRRPEGFDLPRDDRRRRALISCPARVLGPGETASFEVTAPDAPGAYELRAVQFPSFGAPRLLVEGILLEDLPLLSGSISAESFTTAARESVTPFAVLAPESRVTIVVHNVSPTPVPVHPSALLAVLEPRTQQG